jgi:putative sterol carrier protein
MMEAPPLAQIFSEMEKAFQPDAAARIDAVFQYNISGDSGGDWNITVKDQTCEIKEGQAESPTTTLKVSFEDFVAMLTGELNGMQAWTSGKLKIEGDLMKSQLLERIFVAPDK